MIGRALVAGASAAWAGYALLPHLFTPFVASRGPRTQRRLALTFDDGPDPVWTPRVLDMLARHDVRATFFVVGERAARAATVLHAIAEAGHEVASHGWSHTSLWLCGPRRTDREVARTHALIADVTGRPPRHFRPAWGMVNAALFAALGRHDERCVLWSIQPEALRPATAEQQCARVLREAHPGAIVDLHDAEGTPRAPERLVEMLPPTIAGLRDAGYGFATVAELLTPQRPGLT